jgi:hypothetical protein
VKEDVVSRIMREMGKRGGKARMNALTPGERTEHDCDCELIEDEE